MDFNTLRASVLASRRFTATVEALPGAEFTLQAPTRHEAKLHALEYFTAGAVPGVAGLKAQRAMLQAALVGWAGVGVSAIGVQDDAPLAFTPDAAELLIDERPDVADALMTQVVQRVVERDTRFEVASKNSWPASAGNATSMKHAGSLQADSGT
jgi:hypothetical protein